MATTVSRQDYLEDYEYFMALALLTRQRSKDTDKQVGACIVKDNKVIAVGYSQVLDGRGDDNRHEYHAEIDAIMKVADVHGCTMFVTMFPCNECVKVMIQSGIRHVVYLSENETAENRNVKASGKMLRKENVCCEKYMGGKDPITLTFPNEESTEQTVRNRTPESDYFMAVAVLTAQKSRDPSTQVGACIVRDDKVIVAVGHNQMPNNHNDKYTWVRDTQADDNKYLYVCHAELNAILSSTDVRGCTIYVTLFPCSACAKLVIGAGVKKVFYLSDKYSNTPDTIASREMLEAKNIKLVSFYGRDDPQKETIEIKME